MKRPLKKKSKKTDRMSTWFSAMGLVLVLAFTWESGFNVAHHWYGDAVTNGIIALFWVGFLVIFWLERKQDGWFDGADEIFELIGKDLDKLTTELEQEAKNERSNNKQSNTQPKGKGQTVHGEPRQADQPVRSTATFKNNAGRATQKS